MNSTIEITTKTNQKMTFQNSSIVKDGGIYKITESSGKVTEINENEVENLNHSRHDNSRNRSINS